MADADAAGRAALGFAIDRGELTRIPNTATGPERIDAINRLIDAHNELISRTIYTDGQNRRMIVGYQKDGWGSGKHYGIKISKVGYDVLIAADADLLYKLAY